MSDELTMTVTAFVAGSSLIALLAFLFSGRRTQLDARLEGLTSQDIPKAKEDPTAQFAGATLPKLGASIMPSSEEERTDLQTRLLHAGLYQRQAMHIFLGVKLVLMVGPALAGLAVGLTGLISPLYGLVIGGCLGIFGMVGPSFWLDMRKAARQQELRRALPDALDVIVICLEGGLSLTGAIRRVAEELRGAHPALANELAIVQRESQMGRPIGEALAQMGDRSDLEELRSLASVIIQSEKFGAGLVKALRVHAETLREKRLQYAEEMAQQASTKMLFPTIFFILPCVFVVIMGPAVLQISAMFGKMKGGPAQISPAKARR